ncbi:phytoene synthase [Ciceribacter naphthalenivorans]|uniref:Phytoene synthase n=2 Tax=Alphaproteobacteria TaxID=28211 RepID=A0A512HHG9_9HYPH|nr:MULTISPECIES: phytoene/squalene synthase family protein [Alphaproteobacteria]GEO84893.1 phytoene synthase [Ciceribacter naphthalenivorans]GLR22827.1 phytoene synthase [Ciceribacter naphthalenivorans]GLT05683.1 phytoene synthase [Sphingomonas psychrolutea]
MTDAKTGGGVLELSGLRETDRDRYLACLLTPADRRDAVAALYAFNAEIARIRDLVREPLPGEVRLQYWRDLLAGAAHGATEANPIAAALLAAIHHHHLPVSALNGMLDARVFDLYDDPMEASAMFEGYAGETAAALIQLASVVLDPEAAAGTATVAGHAGVAQAIAGALLLLPTHRARGQLYLPLEILSAVGLDRDSFLAGQDKVRISAAVEAFAGLGRDHLRKARDAGPPPRSLVPAYLTVALAEGVLLAAQKRGADVLDAGLRQPQWRRQLRMLSASVKGSF